MPKDLHKEQKANLVLKKATTILAKIAEILHWCLAGVMLVGAVYSIIWPTTAVELIGSDVTLSCYGFNVIITGAAAIAVFAVGSMVVLSLMAMIFRNVYLILKTAENKTWFAKGGTPFQKDVVRMLREIGIFFIAISVISLISTAIVSSLGGEIVNGFNYLGGFMGLVFICISQFFNYGLGLEKDLDGLV